ncbi:DUF2125 domain-containing protein [Dietzia sp. B19]|uniref:hypothetical protein n=1 Tax=Dietzia sp. B19 TaxID=1630632 RepID=UPI0015FBD77D|nr:hypothetical protein [Dietzia sp. B19]MBB1058941.1 DUF2125 domain-containing protein [Dietzia sp. B19]
MELAANHCRQMRFVESGGHGLLEEVSGLPLNSRRVECPVAIGNMSGMQLGQVTFGFYAEHCVGCDVRDPTGRLPNLETEARARRQQVEAQEAKRAEELRVRGVARTGRVERRQSLRATADPATASLLDDLDVIDPDPAVEVDVDATAAAQLRLTTVAGRAAHRFDERIIDELFDAVESVGLAELLEPLRHLTRRRPEFAERLVGAALVALGTFPSLEAGRCLTDHPDLVAAGAVDDATIWAVVTLAGSKTGGDYGFSGPMPVVQANDPGPLRIIADLCPDKMVAQLNAMLPRPPVTGIIVNPEHQPRQVSDFDRWAAAGAVEHLARTHLELAIQLLPYLAVSLGVPPEDSYDPGTVGAAERALAQIFIAAPVRVTELMEDAGRYASEDTRDSIVSSLRHAVDLVDSEYVHRRTNDPVTTAKEREAVTDAAFAFLLARTDESWGHKVTFSAAESIEHMGRWHRDALAGHLDATLGAFVNLTRHRPSKHKSTLTSTAAPDPLAGMEAWARKTSLFQSGRRLLNAIEYASSTDPFDVCDTITTLITSERDSDLGPEVVHQLLATLGEVGRLHGNQPRVLQAILPTLHTYLVDADPDLRAAALEAWTAIGETHALPSTVADLLPALVSDADVVMVDAVLAAACRLPWPDQESRNRLALHAATVAEVINVSKHFDTFLSSLSALRRNVQNLAALAKLEKKALARIPNLEWHQAIKVTEQPWQPDARVAPELAVLRLTLAPRKTYGLRHHGEAEKALNGLLDCGAGLVDLPAADVIKAGVAHCPESPYGSMEYAEVLARAERRTDVVALLEGALAHIPDEPARSSQRALVKLAAAVARLQLTLVPDLPDVANVREAVNEVGQAIGICLGHSKDDLSWLQPFASAAAVRAAVVCTLLNIPSPTEVTAGIADNPAEQSETEPVEPIDPAEQFKARAKRLRYLAAALQRGGRFKGTATHDGIAITARLLDAVTHLLDAEGADLNADVIQASAHRTAVARRATAIDLTTYRGDDPLLPRARVLKTLLAAVPDPAAPLDLGMVLTAVAGLPAPLLFIRSLERHHRLEPRATSAETDSDSAAVAVALVSIDGNLLTGPAIVDPALTHTLTLQIQTDPWPEWVERLDAELISTLNDTELQRPALTWQRHHHTSDPDTYEGTGSLHVRYAVPINQHAPPVLVRLTWRGTVEHGNLKSQPLDVAGHREFRVRPYDPARDATTQYEVFDEHLFSIYEKLAAASYPHNQLQPFARLLNAISRAGLAMTWNKKYRRGQYVRERQFHDDLHAALLADTTLGGRVERGTALGHGYLDTRHDGITAELKVARDQPVTPQSATKYIGQPTQYAAADGARLSILVILDMSPKVLPIGTPENYLFVLDPKQHGMTDPHSPSIVVTLVINGNMPVPSSWSRRKTPTTYN